MVDTLEDSAEIVVINYKNGALDFSALGFTKVGYRPTANCTWADWVNAGHLIRAIDRFKNFAIGDWLNGGEQKWGDTYTAALSEFEWGSLAKLQKLAWVSRAVPMENRRDDLTWSHHAAVAKLTWPEQIDWLSYAALHEMTVSELKSKINEVLQLTSGAIAQQAEEVASEPDYPMDVEDDAESTQDGAVRPSSAFNSTSDSIGWDNMQNGAGGDLLDDYNPFASVQSGVFVAEDIQQAASKLLDTMGDSWCLQLIEQLGILIGDQLLNQ